MEHYKKRIVKEFDDLLYNNSYLYSENIRIASIKDITNYDTKQVYCYIRGPKDSPFENGIFKISIRISENYPYDSPTIKFITPIYHPNLSSETHFSLFSNLDWSPSLTIRSLIITIYSLLVEPLTSLICDDSTIDNIKKPIIDIFLKDSNSWKIRAKEYTDKYATHKLWNIVTHKLYINENKNIMYLLFLGKHFEKEKNIPNDIWITYVMPYIIGKVGHYIITRYNKSISDRYYYNLIT